MERTALATIDLAALKHNLGIVRRYAPQSKVLAVIKANAYGHGLLPVAKALSDADGFAVACLSEALALRRVTSQRIVVLQGFQSADELIGFSDNKLEPVLHQQWQLDAVLQSVVLGQPLSVWLKLGTGMHRLGLDADSLPEGLRGILSALQTNNNVFGVQLMTHMACADNRSDGFTVLQLQEFARLTDNFELPRSVANSATLVGWSESRLEWLRPGIMLYGVNPFDEGVGVELDLQPVMKLSTRLIAVDECKKGDMVGYGGHWVCPRDMRIGVAAIGYGDGYPRHAPNGTTVLVGGRRASVVGRVSMDMLTLDLSECEDANVGAEVTLWGGGLPVEEVAAVAGTIAYELLCSVYGRVNYEYINEER